MTQKYMYPKIFVLGNWEFTATPTTPPTLLRETSDYPKLYDPHYDPKSVNPPTFLNPTQEFLNF